MDSKFRSLTKAIVWRIIGTVDTFILSLLITGKAKWAFGIASFEFLTKTVLYYIHEQVWARIEWGKYDRR